MDFRELPVDDDVYEYPAKGATSDRLGEQTRINVAVMAAMRPGQSIFLPDVDQSAINSLRPVLNSMGIGFTSKYFQKDPRTGMPGVRLWRHFGEYDDQL